MAWARPGKRDGPLPRFYCASRQNVADVELKRGKLVPPPSLTSAQSAQGPLGSKARSWPSRCSHAPAHVLVLDDAAPCWHGRHLAAPPAPTEVSMSSFLVCLEHTVLGTQRGFRFGEAVFRFRSCEFGVANERSWRSFHLPAEGDIASRHGMDETGSINAFVPRRQWARAPLWIFCNCFFVFCN